MISNVVNSLFLLILAVSGNFIGETFGCKAQLYATKSMFVKQILLIAMIYFVINFTGKEAAKPCDAITQTALIWVGFLLFTKQTPIATVISAVFLMATFVLDTNVKYWKEQKGPEAQAKASQLIRYKKYAFGAFIITILIGFLLYFFARKKEYSKDFSYTKFLFGVPKCKSLS